MKLLQTLGVAAIAKILNLVDDQSIVILSLLYC